MNEKSAHIDIDICYLFSEYFVNSHKQFEPIYSDFLFDDLTLDLEITELEISNAVSQLKEKVTIGVDGIPDIFLKNCKDHLLKPLYILYNKSIFEGSVPSI